MEKEKIYSMLAGVLETYRCLINCRKGMPGMKLEDTFTPEAVKDIEREYAWLKTLVEP